MSQFLVSLSFAFWCLCNLLFGVFIINFALCMYYPQDNFKVSFSAWCLTHGSPGFSGHTTKNGRSSNTKSSRLVLSSVCCKRNLGQSSASFTIALKSITQNSHPQPFHCAVRDYSWQAINLHALLVEKRTNLDSEESEKRSKTVSMGLQWLHSAAAAQDSAAQ